MREIIKYLLGIVIILTIIYTLFISYNVFNFINSEESNASIDDYVNNIEFLESERQQLEEIFNQSSFKESSNNININYDGTPISWVIEISLEEIPAPPDVLEKELLKNGFIFFMKDENLFIGPYIDKSQLDFVIEFFKETYNFETNDIQKWEI
tara:strand:+ start:241 stop:699 length:459 start_codon:yes stop_codon:yes gene_type:complete